MTHIKLFLIGGIGVYDSEKMRARPTKCSFSFMFGAKVIVQTYMTQKERANQKLTKICMLKFKVEGHPPFMHKNYLAQTNYCNIV